MATRGTSVRSDPPLVVIVGPTASGKTGVAIKLAEKFGGEIVCADSRTIYKGMDIGTAKPTAQERARVPHWGLDLVEPDERFTAADFKIYASLKIEEIRARGHIPFLVGGTGLYIDAVLFDYTFSGSVDLKRRVELSKQSVEDLQNYCIQNNIKLPENINNKRYLIGAIERAGLQGGRNNTPADNSIVVGIATEAAMLSQRIEQRAEQLFEDGIVEEAITLGKKYGWEGEAFTGNVYRVIRSYLIGELSQEEMMDKFIILDRQLAKRQRTWFKRNPFIHWLPLEKVESYISDRLAK